MKNKQFAWELFKNTGNIDAYLIMKDVEYSEQMMENTKESSHTIGESNGINQDQGNRYQGS